MKAADIVYPGEDRTFQRLYCDPAIDKKSVVEACDSAETKAQQTQAKGKLRTQEEAASNLLIEYTSFAMESLFDEMKGVNQLTCLIDRYKSTYSETHVSSTTGAHAVSAVDTADIEVHKVAQEVVAVAINQVIEHTIIHISQQN